jgi:hypothetical protein
MKFIDSSGKLPGPLKRAIEFQEKAHNPKSDISCTGLISSPLLFWLRKKYYDQITEDYRDRLWALYGSLVHSIVERFGKSEDGSQHVERTVMTDVLGWKVSAQLDYLKTGESLTDWKFTSCWATMNGVKPEWTRQLNVCLWILRHADDEESRKIGAAIKRLEICAIFRDWVPSNQDKFPNNIEVLPVKVWSDAESKRYIEERVALHQAAANTEGVPPCCTDEERWKSDFAVCLNNKKTALKAKIKTREEAEHWMKELGADYIREAKPRRCEEYCVYAKSSLCPWYDYEAKTTRTEPLLPEKDSVATDTDSQNRKDGPNV